MRICFLFEWEYKVSLKVEQGWNTLCNSGFEKIYTAVEDNVFDDKKLLDEFSEEKRQKKKGSQMVSVHLDRYIVAPVDDCPLIPIPYPSNNTLHRSQIDNLIGTRSFVVVDIVC